MSLRVVTVVKTFIRATRIARPGLGCWRRFANALTGRCTLIAVETPDANLSSGMRQLNGVYTQLTNRLHQRVGHVFQGRFKAIVVDRDNYLLELARYVVLNPVRAGMVQDAGAWPWSSYGAMLAPAGQPAPQWLATDKLLAYFAPEQQPMNREIAQQRYIDHVREGVGLPSVWEALSGQVYLGDEKFVSKMSALAEQSPQQHRGQVFQYHIPLPPAPNSIAAPTINPWATAQFDLQTAVSPFNAPSQSTQYPS